jgi:hypothetical protein
MEVTIIKNGNFFSAITCGEERLNYVINHMTRVLTDLKNDSPNNDWYLKIEKLP